MNNARSFATPQNGNGPGWGQPSKNNIGNPQSHAFNGMASPQAHYTGQKVCYDGLFVILVLHLIFPCIITMSENSRIQLDSPVGTFD
jgi:hypothetical protein